MGNFHETFKQLRIVPWDFDQWLQIYKTICIKHWIFPFIFSISIIYCTSAILRCIVNFYEIFQEYESESSSKSKNKLSIKTIFRVQIVCQCLQLMSFCILLSGLIRYNGKVLVPWLFREIISIYLGFIKHTWNIVMKKEALDLIYLLSISVRLYFVLFVYYLRNYFAITDITKITIRDISWF